MGRRRKETRLGGKNPLSYMGIEASDSPVLLFSYDRAPTSSDKRGFRVGTIWHDRSQSPVDVHMLVALDPNSATWVKILSTAMVATQYDADSGSAVPASGILNILGSSVLTTSGSGNTITAAFTSATDGQVIIGGGSAPAWGNITSVGGTIIITETANGINLEASGTSALLTLTADSGVATEAAGNINILGGTNLNTSAAGSTLSTQLDTNVDISGSLTLSAQGAGVLQANAGGGVSSSSGDDGELLIGATGGSAQWANITSLDSTIDITNGANSINLEFTAPSAARYPFMAFQGSPSTSILGGSGCPGYYLGNDAPLQLGQMQEIFDPYSVFNPGAVGVSATFTAPIDGKYYLCLKVIFRGANISVAGKDYYFTLSIETSNRNYNNYTRLYMPLDPVYPSYVQRESYVCADMDAGDIAQYFVNITNLTTPGNLWRVQDTPGYRDTWVCGYLL